MLSFADFSDFCDLNEQEIQSISSAAGVSLIQACAMAHKAEDDPGQSRKMLQLMQEHLEKVEHHKDSQASKEIHDAIHHFAARHRFI